MEFSGTGHDETGLWSTLGNEGDAVSLVYIYVVLDQWETTGDDPITWSRQGDLISRYLFLRCAVAFSSLLMQAAREMTIHGINICRGAPHVSRLFFADDSILFVRRTREECSRVAEIISLYDTASGQNMNYEKSEVVFSKNVLTNVTDRSLGWERWSMINIWAWDCLLWWGGLRRPLLRDLRNGYGRRCAIGRVRCSQSCSAHKAIAQAIPTYIMSVFRLPDMVSLMIYTPSWQNSSGDRRKGGGNALEVWKKSL